MRSKGGTSPQTSYLKFRVPAVPAGTSLQTATLTLSTTANSWASSVDPQQLMLVTDSSWSEATMTYDTAPAVSATVLGSFTGIGVDGSTTVTLDAGALAAYAGQDVTIAIVGGGNDNAEYDTSEAPSGQPVLSVLIG
jgi:hypothetical protein